MSEQKRTLAIHVPVLARVEGEGALDLRIENGDIAELRLRIFEPPRYFEKFLEGHHYTEIPDMVARICGICPAAYQTTAAQALEKLFGVELDPWARDMRRVFYCGEWIQSHSLHIHLLAAPDFFGCNSAIELARLDPGAVRRGLRIQALGNELMDLFGARSVHPVGIRIGGFHAAPSLPQIRAIREKLRAALPDAEALIRWAADFPVPEDDQGFTSVALQHASDYAIEHGRIAVSDGSLIEVDAFTDHFVEHHEAFSTALFSTYQQQPYLVGPLARLNLNHARLPERVRLLLAETGIALPSHNLFHSMLARSVEILLALHEALRLLDAYRVPDAPFVAVTPRAGVAKGCTEAPRGLLWQRYEMDGDGCVVNARIVPPTSQNQGRIEEDLRQSLLSLGLDHPDEVLRLHCEKVIRNYDPCISCATHFLRMRVERT
jgi:sulfhydrogenase subunit alpha